ncbi:DJ-1/PfpI family protein [Fulvivirga sp.]|uniref:DJ-1/PfpI family protein n=1 Tax=Fulvivirga sp. TaxID=1931237 RepID=UPI0032EADAF9
MLKTRIYLSLILTTIFFGCNSDKPASVSEESVVSDTTAKHIKPFNPNLPTIGLLMYDGVLTTEVTAAADVFTKPSESGEQLFNVITIAESKDAIVSEEGLTMIADYTFANCPKLEVLFVPSAYDMWEQVHNERIVDFIRNKNNETTYTVSNCAGAQLIGASGIAKGKKIVTWIGGGKQLQIDYPELLVQDDSLVTYVEDGKFSSSNGNLASYISSLILLEKMTSPEHRAFVESYLYLDRLQDWETEDKN